ncbi:cell division protein FtsK [Yinghuangia seranimata]|uniref:cell division protein FtsK n=1 Tax=Yinghuangia seranimata TaxID=408067 RepID=UPI00248B5B24|nr:cell division protein FtsK [Yinghuangia seranimata]MDI2126945.1 cell division protein FtsK [Yinghuangia seranimata]
MTHTDLFGPDSQDNTPAEIEEPTAEVIPLRKERPPAEPANTDPADTAEPETEPDTGDEGEQETTVPVDGPALARPSWQQAIASGERREVLPAWLLSQDELRERARWTLDHFMHVFAFHAVRTPVYAGTLAIRSPLGAARLVGGAFRWVSDADSRPIRANAIAHNDAAEYLRLAKHRDGKVRLRLTILLAAMLGTAVLLTALIVAGPTWGTLLALAGIVGGLGWFGAPQDRPLIGPAVVKPQVQKLTSHIVLRALGALGIAEINKAVTKGWGPRAFVAPITRDGPGWRADVDLPYGVTAVDIIERRDRLASGLRRPMGCVWPEPVHTQHTGRLVIWVGDQDMNQLKQPEWPLAKSGTASLFKPIPFGTDQRGRTVAFTLMFANMLIGAMPRFGKTFSLRVAMLAVALDVLAELHTWELKGTGDLEAPGRVSHTYGSGPDDETLAGCMDMLRYVYGDLERRAKVIRGLPRDVCPENKVTPELSAKKSLRLHPLVVAIDECQELFSHPKFGAEAADLCTGIIKRGPALGVILLLATQRPDKDSMPTGVSANVGIRFCLRVMGQTENDMVLGTSSYKNGLRATTFTRADTGIGYLVGHATDAEIVRSFYIDGPTADRICERARAARIAAGTLSGYAAGETTGTEQTPAHDLLADVLAVVPASEERVWNETVVDRLAELRPDAYGPWATLGTKAKSAQLTAALKPHGVAVDQVWGTDETTGKGANRRGIEREHIAAAITKRDARRRSD